MRAVIRLATAQPSRVVDAVQARLREFTQAAPEGAPEPRVDFEAPDAMRLEGDVAWIGAAFEVANEILDLPPRVRVEARLETQQDQAPAGPEVERRLWKFARLAAARHSPKARFEVVLGGVGQLGSAWLDDDLEAVRRTLAEDIGHQEAPLERLRVALGHGDARLELDLLGLDLVIEARDTGALDAVELAQGALEDSADFRAAWSTFEEASATPSEAADREHKDLEARNRARRTGTLLAQSEEPVEDLVRRLGVGRVRAFLEGPCKPEVSLERRAEALRRIAAPGRGRAVVRLVLDGVRSPDFSLTEWLDALAEEPETAACAGFEELLLAGVSPEEVSRRMVRLDPRAAARALAKAATLGDDDVRGPAADALVALGPDAARHAFASFPSHRRGLEACWQVIRRLGEADGPSAGKLLNELFHETMKLAETDPAARYLAGQLSQARGDHEGAARYFEEAAERARDRSLVSRARMAGAALAFERGRIEDAVGNLLELARSLSGGERLEALAELARCFRKLDLAGFAAVLEAPERAEDDVALDLVDAWMQARAGDFAKAAEGFGKVDEAVRLRGEPARSYAAALRAAGKDRQAVELLQRVCEQTPEDPRSAYQLARLLHEIGDDEACEAPLEQALRADPSYARALHLKGLLCEKGGRYDEAARCFEGAIGGSEELSSAYSGLARSYTAAERYEEAAKVYRRSLEVGPECILPAYRELGRLYEGHLGDSEQALFWYQRYLTHGGEDPEVLESFKQLTAKVQTYPKSVGRGLS